VTVALLVTAQRAIHALHRERGEFRGQGTRFGYFDVGSSRFAFYAFNNTPAGGSLNALRSLFKGYADPVPAIVEALEQQKIYRDDIVGRLPPGTQWGQGQVTLIGDAAHPVQPTLGQGGCMAVEDSFELASLLCTPYSADVAENFLSVVKTESQFFFNLTYAVLKSRQPVKLTYIK